MAKILTALLLGMAIVLAGVAGRAVGASYLESEGHGGEST
jgi:hypothetical protein